MAGPEKPSFRTEGGIITGDGVVVPLSPYEESSVKSESFELDPENWKQLKDSAPIQASEIIASIDGFDDKSLPEQIKALDEILSEMLVNLKKDPKKFNSQRFLFQELESRQDDIRATSVSPYEATMVKLQREDGGYEKDPENWKQLKDFAPVEASELIDSIEEFYEMSGPKQIETIDVILAEMLANLAKDPEKHNSERFLFEELEHRKFVIGENIKRIKELNRRKRH